MNLKECYVFLLMASFGVRRNEVVIKFQDGRIKGIITTSSRGTEYYLFRGIFYAESPAGSRRFKPPVTKRRLLENEEFDATEDGPVCWQRDQIFKTILGQEDCLILNVFTHATIISNKNNKYPVIVWIHGGAWRNGFSSSWLYGPGHFMDKEVVIVSINYRLGPFGFLSTNDDSSPGNYGMLDQLEALKWINRNIMEFGGDPEKVTLFGQSAGAVSAIYHMLSPLSKGLFHGCIAMSGTPLSPWANVNDPIYWARKLADKLNCPLEDNTRLVECLRTVDAKEITELVHTLSAYDQCRFFPTVDGKFLEYNPQQMLVEGRIYSKVPVITGVTKDEGSGIYAVLHQKLVEFSDEFLYGSIEVFHSYAKNATTATNLIKDKYYNTANVDFTDKFEIFKLTSKYMSDGMDISTYATVDYLTDAGVKTYTYSSDFQGLFSVMDVVGIPRFGVGHGDDVFQVFDIIGFSISDDEISNRMISRWTNFAIYGDPNRELELNWSPAAKNEIPVFHIDKPCSIQFVNRTNDQRFDFWLKEVPEALNLNIYRKI